MKKRTRKNQNNDDVFFVDDYQWLIKIGCKKLFFSIFLDHFLMISNIRISVETKKQKKNSPEINLMCIVVDDNYVDDDGDNDDDDDGDDEKCLFIIVHSKMKLVTQNCVGSIVID